MSLGHAQMIVDYQCTNYISDALVGFVRMGKEDKERGGKII